MNRRGFLTGAVAFLAAPPIVRAASLEYVPTAPKPVFRFYAWHQSNSGSYGGFVAYQREGSGWRAVALGPGQPGGYTERELRSALASPAASRFALLS